MKKCLGCNIEYADGVWISDEGLCGKCNRIAKNSQWQEWDSVNKKWKRKRQEKITKSLDNWF